MSYKSKLITIRLFRLLLFQNIIFIDENTLNNILPQNIKFKKNYKYMLPFKRVKNFKIRTIKSSKNIIIFQKCYFYLLRT